MFRNLEPQVAKPQVTPPAALLIELTWAYPTVKSSVILVVTPSVAQADNNAVWLSRSIF